MPSERQKSDRIALAANHRSPRLRLLWLMLLLPSAAIAAPAPPTNIRVEDHPWDGGRAVDVTFDPAVDDGIGTTTPVRSYSIRRSGEYGGLYTEVATIDGDGSNRPLTVAISDSVPGKPYWFRVVAVGEDGSLSDFAETPENAPAVASRQFLDGSRVWLGILSGVICGSVVVYIALARAGKQLYVRKIAGLEAVEEAVGRATEMGRSCLFVPGVLDMNDIQTISCLTILSRVAERAAEYDARLEVPTSKSLVMTAARETMQAAFLSAGRPDAYNEDLVSYITDEQFGYVAYLTGQMVREKPAACFYFGGFYAESLILAETGNSIGAIQVAGTAQPAQLPFFVAACDYTLIGEEFFAASAYLSHDPDQLGSLKGQDFGKLIAAGLMIAAVGLLTLGAVTHSEPVLAAADYIRNVILSPG